MTTKDFIAKLNDMDLNKKMEDTKSLEEAYAVAKEYGVTDNLETFKEKMEALESATGELSDDNLGAVVGGMAMGQISKNIIVIQNDEPGIGTTTTETETVKFTRNYI